MFVKNYTDYTSEDFATEPLFIKWVQQPDNDEVANFWKLYTNKNPHKHNDMAEAKAIVQVISDQFTGIETTENKNLWHRIQTSVSQLPEIDELDQNLKPIASTIYFTRWAVATVMGVGFIIWFLIQISRM